jgi:hypothetical protein
MKIIDCSNRVLLDWLEIGLTDWKALKTAKGGEEHLWDFNRRLRGESILLIPALIVLVFRLGVYGGGRFFIHHEDL